MSVSTTKVVLLSIFLFLGMVLSGIIMQPDSSLEVWNIEESDFPQNNSSSQDRLTFLLNYAILAPSSHNSQPWRFNVSEDRVQVFADQSRWLSVADPGKREMYLSLGAALENLIIAAERFGYNCTISYFPGEKDLVADISLKHVRGGASNLALFEAITSRRTNRNPYQMKAISDSEAADLYRYSSHPDVEVFLSQDSDTIEAFRELVADADGILYSDINYKSELGSWLGQGVMGPTGVEAKLAQLAVVFMDVGPEQIRKDSGLLNSTQCIGFICTAENDSLSSVKAGQVLERLWLAATARGIALHPMSQPLEVPETRERLDAMVPAESEKRVVQQTFRLGSAISEGAHSSRRPLQDVLIND